MIGESWQISETILLATDFVYTYSKSKFQSSFFSNFSQWGLVNEGDSLPYIPEHVGRLDVAFDSDKLSVNLAAKYQHGMREVPGIGAVDSDLHTDNLVTLDLSISKELGNDSDIKFSVRNLMDERHIVSHRPFGARPNLPRMLMLEGRYKL